MGQILFSQRFFGFDLAAAGDGLAGAFAAAGGGSAGLATREPLVAVAGVADSAVLPLTRDAISARTSAGVMPTMVAVRA